MDSLPPITFAGQPPDAQPLLSTTTAGLLPVTKSSTRDNTNTCYFLKKAPLEVRIMIYKLLLVNPILGDIGSQSDIWHRRYRPHPIVPYGLFPQILRTCRKIEIEASAIFYGYNAFMLSCLEKEPKFHTHLDRDRFDRLNDCPLSRYERSLDETKDLQQIKSFSKVRHWRILVEKPEFKAPLLPLVIFCNSIWHTKPQSVLVVIFKRDPRVTTIGQALYTKDFMDVLHPLRNLREISVFGFGATKGPHHFVQEGTMQIPVDANSTIVFPGPGNELQAQMQRLVTSNDAVQPSFKLFENLASYAKSFERFETFKLEMTYGRMPYHRPQTTRLPPRVWSPFQAPLHPMERALVQAKGAANEDDLVTFKRYRTLVLEYLEPQYQRILAAASNIAEYIKAEKTYGGIFNTETTSEIEDIFLRYRDKFTTMVILIEDYAKSFVRDVPFEVRVNIRQHQTKFNSYYSPLPREMALRQLEICVEQGVFDGVYALFKKLVTDMDTQYLQIREARDNLKWDETDDLGFALDIVKYGSAEDMKIDWDVNEPEITAFTYKEDLEMDF